MQARAHGWTPDQFRGPSKKVAKEFVRADEAKRIGKAEALGNRKKKLDKWARAREKAKSNVGEYKT